MPQRLTALRVMSDEFFKNSFFEYEIAISTLQYEMWRFVRNAIVNANSTNYNSLAASCFSSKFVAALLTTGR